MDNENASNASQENGRISFFGHLETLLRTNRDYVAEDGRLLRNKVAEAAATLDPALLRLLVSDVETKKRFFTEVDGTLVFDKAAFGWTVENREFLPDSFTRFKNRIGLADSNGGFLSSSPEVVLSFPYKDCVLEGGQTKEDQKRREVFYNRVLAPDEVDRLLEPKALCHAVRHDKGGTRPATTFDPATDNLLIKGNNLLALASLLPRYEGKVNLIYIDPPFNTGNDSFNYNDSFSRSSWLVFMRNRLELAKQLLAEDGNIVIHIDINQSHYLKILCDELFRNENFVEEIIWAYGSPSGGRAASPKPVNVHDYLLHYAKNYGTRKQNRVYIPYSKKYIEDWFKYVDEDGRRYQRRQRGKDEKGDTIWIRQYLDESKGIPLSTVWTDIQQVYADPRAYKEGTKADVEVIKAFKGGQKPEALLKRIMEMTTNPGDLVLDFHAGTGTTGATALKLGRRFILCEQLDSQIGIIETRLAKTISGDTAGISKAAEWTGGGSFVSCELAVCNARFAEEIAAAGDDETLEALLWKIVGTGYASHRVWTKALKSYEADFAALGTEEKRQVLFELLDANMLYVNKSDIDDAESGLTDADKAFTRSFYGE
jgi:adenine-specific DNA-methyltransferase